MVCWGCVLSTFGALFLLAIFTRFLFFVLRHFTGSKVSISKLCGSKPVKESWAVVTGSSDGIGRGYALELAKRGLNVVLISRTQEKLDQVAEEIRSKYNVETRVLAVDFVSADDATYKRIADSIKDIPVAVLVNNVGINYEYPQRYLEAPEKLDESIIHVNITATNKLTRIVLPQMVERKGGAIINLSSMAGRVPTPMLTVYSATKAYIDFFSKGLAQEYAKYGILVQSVTPGMVVSNMSKIRRTSLMVSSPAHIAKRSIDRLGCEYEISPYYFHAIIIYFMNALPLSFIANRLLAMNEVCTMLPKAKLLRRRETLKLNFIKPQLFSTVVNELGDKMKKLETALEPPPIANDLPFLIRLDGHCFKTFCRSGKQFFNLPFDTRIHNAMILTCHDLMKEFQCVAIYTFSDEITMIFPKQFYSNTTHQFNGRYSKLISVTAGFTSAKFNHHIGRQIFSPEEEFIQRKATSALAYFDSRLFSLQQNSDIMDNIRWRQWDCSRNSKNLMGVAYLKGGTPSGVTANEVIELVKEKSGHSWHNQPYWFRYGTLIKRIKVPSSVFVPVKNQSVTFDRTKFITCNSIIRDSSEENIELLLEKLVPSSYLETGKLIEEDYCYTVNSNSNSIYY